MFKKKDENEACLLVCNMKMAMELLEEVKEVMEALVITKKLSDEVVYILPEKEFVNAVIEKGERFERKVKPEGKQVKAIWYDPETKLPDEGTRVPVKMSGKRGNVNYLSALEMAEYYEDEGWVVDDFEMDQDPDTWMTIEAWLEVEL